MIGALVERGQSIDYHQFSSRVLVEQKPVTPLVSEKPQRETLLGEIHHLRNNWQKEGLPKNWVDLPGVGFLVGYQMGFLDSEKLKHLSFEQRKNLWTETTQYSLQGWVREYLQGRLTFPGELTLHQNNGQWKMRDTRHGAGLDVEDTLSKKERNGSVWSVVVDVAKPFLVNAPDGSLVVKQSPHGPSGIRDNTGTMIDYPDSHWEILQKKGNKIYTYTIKTDYDHNEHREAMRRLRIMAGQQPSLLHKDAPLEDYVLTTANFNSNEKPVKLSEVIDVFKKTRLDLKGSKYAMGDKTWDEVYEDMGKNIEDLWKYDQVTDTYITQFVDFAKSGNWTKDTLKEALSATILRLSKYVLSKERENKLTKALPELSRTVEYTIRPGFPPTPYVNSSYGSAFSEVKTIKGCAGGGQGDSKAGYAAGFDASYSSFFGLFDKKKEKNESIFDKMVNKEEEKEEEKEPFTCPRASCGLKTTEKVGNQCPKCGLTKEQFIAEGGVAC